MKEETLRDIGEFECIHRIAHDLIYRPELVKLGTGDDGAVFMTPCGYDEVISTTPDGEQFNQKMANTLSLSQNLIILCGHFKGIDYRIREHFITKEISIGEYVLSGGELARRGVARPRRRADGGFGIGKIALAI